MELSDSPESTVFYHSDHAGACFPAMEDIRRLGKLCDVTLVVGKCYPPPIKQLFGGKAAVLQYCTVQRDEWLQKVGSATRTAAL